MICSHYGNKTERTWVISSRVSYRLDPKISKKDIKGRIEKFHRKTLIWRSGLSPRRWDRKIQYSDRSCAFNYNHTSERYSVSRIVGKIKANTSREIRKKFTWIKKIYWRNEFWSPGFFSSTVGIDEEVIKKYVEFQEKLDKGQLSFEFKFEVPRA